jgi:hypothetical protein
VAGRGVRPRRRRRAYADAAYALGNLASPLNKLYAAARGAWLQPLLGACRLALAFADAARGDGTMGREQYDETCRAVAREVPVSGNLRGLPVGPYVGQVITGIGLAKAAREDVTLVAPGADAETYEEFTQLARSLEPPVAP